MGSTMTIGKKLTLATGAIVLAALVLGIAALSTIGRLSDQLVNSTTKTSRRLQLAGVIDAAGGDMLSGQRGMVLYAYAKSPENVETSKALFDQGAARWERAITDFRPLIVTEEGKQLIGQLEEQLNAWRAVNPEILEKIKAGDPDGAAKIGAEKVRPIYEANSRDTDRLIETQNEILAKEKAEGESIGGSGRLLTLILMGVSLATGVFVLFMVRRTSAALQQTAADLSESASQVANASGQVSSSSQALAQGASEQAASLEQTSASSEEITSMTRKNADNSRTAADLMGETAHVVEQANHTLEQMEGSMREINESSDKVGKIIKVIDEIAFQTNILALNAAVEAARAGEAGAGFAVVAEEVRNLAQRSAQAAKETAAKIEGAIAKTGQGVEISSKVAQTLNEIVTKARQVDELVAEVASASREQTQGTTQINTAVGQMDKVTQSNAANAEESAAAAEELNAQATVMKESVSELLKLVGGRENRQAIGDRTPVTPVAKRPALARANRNRNGHALAAPETATTANHHGEIQVEGDYKDF